MKIKYLSVVLLMSALTLSSCGDDKKDEKKKENTDSEQISEDESDEDIDSSDDLGSEDGADEVWSYGKKYDEDTKLYGFVDEYDNWVIKPQFAGANFNFQFDRGAVKNEDWIWGYCDINGDMIIPYQYKSAGDFSKDGLATVKTEDKKWLVIDKDGQTTLDLGNKYDYVGNVLEGLINVSNADGESGFINTKGDLIIDLKYESATSYIDFDGSGTYFNKENGVGTFAHKSTGKKGLLNKKGEELCEFKYDAMPVYAKDNGTIVVKIGDKFGAINDKGVEILPCEYDKVSVTNMSSSIKAEKDGEAKEFNFDGSPA